MKKLLYIITRTQLGGAQRHLFELINYFKNYYTVSLICGEKDWLYHQAKQLGIEAKYLKELARHISPVNDYRAFRRITRYITSNQIDLVHTHSTKAGFVGRSAASYCKVPVLFTAHGWGFHPKIPFIRRNFVRFVEKLLGRRTHKIICVSEYDKNLALKYKIADSESLITIYNGLPDTLFLKNYNLGNSIIKLVMIARFNEQKDQASLISAFQSLNLGTKIELHFIGDGPALLSIKKLAASKPNIIFHGSKDNIEQVLPEFDIFILCSHWEGLPISIIEAFRSALPVVASNTGGVGELFEHGTQYLVEDTEQLAKQLDKLIADPRKRMELGLQNRTYFLKKLTREKMLIKTAEIYQSTNC